MKNVLLTLMATGVALTGCGAPPSSLNAATFSQDSTLENPYQLQGGKSPKPFFKKDQLEVRLEDGDAAAEILEGYAPADQASKIKFSVKGMEKLSKSHEFVTNGKLDFQDKTRKLRFRGKVDDKSSYLSEQILYANLQGYLDDGSRFTMDIGEISIYQVFFTFQVTRDDQTLYRYTGIAEKGKLRLQLK